MAAKHWPCNQHFGEQKNGQFCTYSQRVEDLSLYPIRPQASLTAHMLFCFGLQVTGSEKLCSSSVPTGIRVVWGKV